MHVTCMLYEYMVNQVLHVHVMEMDEDIMPVKIVQPAAARDTGSCWLSLYMCGKNTIAGVSDTVA